MGFIRPMFGSENPLFRHLDLYHAYTARLSYLLSLGTPRDTGRPLLPGAGHLGRRR